MATAPSNTSPAHYTSYHTTTTPRYSHNPYGPAAFYQQALALSWADEVDAAIELGQQLGPSSADECGSEGPLTAPTESDRSSDTASSDGCPGYYHHYPQPLASTRSTWKPEYRVPTAALQRPTYSTKAFASPTSMDGRQKILTKRTTSKKHSHHKADKQRHTEPAKVAAEPQVEDRKSSRPYRSEAADPEMRRRWDFVFDLIMGQRCEVVTTDGTRYEGILHSKCVGDDFSVKVTQVRLLCSPIHGPNSRTFPRTTVRLHACDIVHVSTCFDDITPPFGQRDQRPQLSD